MQYNAPTGSTDLNAPYVGKNVAAGLQGSKVPPKAVENTQREIVNAIIAAGLTPTNDDLTQLAQAIRALGIPIGVASGSPNAIVTTLAPGPASWAALRLFLVRITAGNTAAATIAPNGLSARNIIHNDGTTASASGDLASGGIALFLNDGTNVQLIAMLGAALQIPDTQIWHFSTAASTIANAYTGPLSPLLATGATIYFEAVQFPSTNTGPATFNGAPIIIDKTGAALVAGQLPTINRARMLFDGTSHRLENPVFEAAPRVIATYDSRTGALQGMTLSVSGSNMYTFTLLNPPPNGYSVGSTPGVSSYGNTTITFQPSGNGGIGTMGKSASQFAILNFDAGGNHNALGDVIVTGW